MAGYVTDKDGDVWPEDKDSVEVVAVMDKPKTVKKLVMGRGYIDVPVTPLVDSNPMAKEVKRRRGLLGLLFKPFIVLMNNGGSIGVRIRDQLEMGDSTFKVLALGSDGKVDRMGLPQSGSYANIKEIVDFSVIEDKEQARQDANAKHWADQVDAIASPWMELAGAICKDKKHVHRIALILADLNVLSRQYLGHDIGVRNSPY